MNFRIKSLTDLADCYGWTVTEESRHHTYITHGNVQVRCTKDEKGGVLSACGYRKNFRYFERVRHWGSKARLWRAVRFLHGADHGFCPFIHVNNFGYTAEFFGLDHAYFGFDIAIFVPGPVRIELHETRTRYEGSTNEDLSMFREAATQSIPNPIFWDWAQDRFKIIL